MGTKQIKVSKQKLAISCPRAEDKKQHFVFEMKIRLEMLVYQHCINMYMPCMPPAIVTTYQNINALVKRWRFANKVECLLKGIIKKPMGHVLKTGFCARFVPFFYSIT